MMRQIAIAGVIAALLLTIAGCTDQQSARVPATPAPATASAPESPAVATPASTPGMATLILPFKGESRLTVFNPTSNQSTALIFRDGTATLAPGNYQFRGTYQAIAFDQSGARWTATARVSGPLAAAAGSFISLPFGPPLTIAVRVDTAPQADGSLAISASPLLTDAAGNQYTISRGAEPQAPAFTVRRADTNQLVLSGKFEFG